MTEVTSKSRAEQLIIALDCSEPERTRELVSKLGPLGVGFKAGLQLFMSGGPSLVADLALRCRLFLDLKFHDIPRTTASAVKEAALLNVWMINVHAAGGRKMMAAARDVLAEMESRPLLTAVTVLTSMDDSQLVETGVSDGAAERVRLLSRLAADCGLDGVVCSPLEIRAVKKAVSPSFITVTPGIRPAGEAGNDQSRVAAPAEVIRAGGDYLVVGRPVTGAVDPVGAARKILEEMGTVI